MAKLSSKDKIREYAEYFGETFLESYFHLVDMGEIRESESLRTWAEKNEQLEGQAIH